MKEMGVDVGESVREGVWGSEVWEVECNFVITGH